MHSQRHRKRVFGFSNSPCWLQIDTIFVSYSALSVRLANLSAHRHDLTDSCLSSLRGDSEWFRSVILISGTRCTFFSRIVLVRRKLHRFSVQVSLHLIEGTGHYQYFGNQAADKLQEVFLEMTILNMRNCCISFCERETMRSLSVVLALVCGVFLLAGLTQAAESPQVAEYTHHMAVSKKVPGLHACLLYTSPSPRD